MGPSAAKLRLAGNRTPYIKAAIWNYIQVGVKDIDSNTEKSGSRAGRESRSINEKRDAAETAGKECRKGRKGPGCVRSLL